MSVPRGSSVGKLKLGSLLFFLEFQSCCIGLLLCALASLDIQRWKQATSDPTRPFLHSTTSWQVLAEGIKNCVSNSCVSLSSLLDTFKTERFTVVTDEEAALFLERLNSQSQDQLTFLPLKSMYHNPQYLKSSLKPRLNSNLKRLHFLFRVENTSSGHHRVSQEGQYWGYLSFSSNLENVQFGSFYEGNLPVNLLQFFLPVFEAVMESRGMKMTTYPPKPSIKRFRTHIAEDDETG